MTMTVGEFARECGGLITDVVEKAREQLIGQEVILTRGKYDGRFGEVMGIIPDGEGIRVLVYPYRRDGKGFLNDHLDARTYWSINDILWKDDRAVDNDEIIY